LAQMETQLPPKGAQPLNFWPMSVVAKQSPILATAELLLYVCCCYLWRKCLIINCLKVICVYEVIHSNYMYVVLFHKKTLRAVSGWSKFCAEIFLARIKCNVRPAQ